MKIETLAELNPADGKTVECMTAGSNRFTEGKRYKIAGRCILTDGGASNIIVDVNASRFRIVDDEPRPWSELTRAEKGELLLAEHEGKDIQVKASETLWVGKTPGFSGIGVYRIKPEPVVDTSTCWWGNYMGFTNGIQSSRDTHRITFETIDGEPDVTSIKMEKLT